MFLPEEALGKMLTLRSSDEVDFEVPEKVAMESRTIKEWLQEGSRGGSPILLHNVSSEILRPVLHFCRFHAQARASAAASLGEPTASAASSSGKPTASAASSSGEPTASAASSSGEPAASAAASSGEPAASAAASSSKPAAAAASAPGEPSKIKVISEKDLKAFNANFMETHDKSLLYLIEAAEYLGIKELIDLTLDTAANKIKGKTPEQIRKILNINNDFTPEEEEKARKENKWVFEEQR